jgi:uncharacterized protein YndB with AHSA1/START domain
MTTLSKVGNTTFTTPTDHELVATQTIDAPRERVWEALTNCAHLKHWMLGPDGWTMPVCENELRVGGTWHFGWRGPDGTVMEMNGVYKELVRPEKIVNTENWGTDWPETLSTQTLTEENGRTKIHCTLVYPSKEARERAIETGMKDGWAASWDRLNEFLQTTAKR